MKINDEFIKNALQYNISEDKIRILEDLDIDESLEKIFHNLSLKLPQDNIEYLLFLWMISILRQPTSEDNIIKSLNIIYKIDEDNIISILESHNIKIHPQNIDIIESILKKNLAESKIIFESHHNLEAINNFIENKSWEKVYSSLSPMHNNLKFIIKSPSIHALHILMQLKDKPQLYKLIAEVRDIPCLWGIFANLSPSRILNLTYESNDDYIIFCTLSALFPFEHPPLSSLTDNEEQLVALLLYKPEYEKSFLIEILKIFNTYPIRYPTLQRSLGKALAISNSESYINLYCTSLSLHPLNCNDKGREHIKLCLEEFNKIAADELKNKLYAIIFKLWTEWNFNIHKNDHLFNIKFSLLDYAIVKYYKTTLSDEEISILIEKKIEEILDINNNWYKNYSKFITQWYCYLSTLQPLFHLQALKNDTEPNYLQVNTEYQFEKIDRFTSIRIRK